MEAKGRNYAKPMPVDPIGCHVVVSMEKSWGGDLHEPAVRVMRHIIQTVWRS